ncbi:hypothetical protein KC315_g13218 [Hortaea werneckii]|nr:hypothetical protein KC315_g13218 [Hortaea werneckii]
MIRPEISDSQESDNSIIVASAPSQPSAPTGQTRGASAGQKPPRNWCGCDGDVEDDSTVACKGPGHAQPRYFHVECIEGEVDLDTWRCPVCTSQEPQTSSQPSSQVEAPEWNVKAILDKRIGVAGNVEYLVKWAPVPGFPRYDDEWLPEGQITADELIGAFERGETAADEDDETEDSVSDIESADVEAGNPYRSHLLRGYWSLARGLYLDVQRHAAAESLPGFEPFREIACQILASVPYQLLLSVCGSGMIRRKLADPGLSFLLDENMTKSKGRPCIYLLEFVDKDGLGPNIKEMRHIIERARCYTNPETDEDVNFAIRVDGVAVDRDLSSSERAKIRNGYRKYIDGSERTKQRIVALLDGLSAHLDALDDQSDTKRVPFLIRNVGYTDDGERRVDSQHFFHRSSNKVMNLIEATAFAEDLIGNRYSFDGGVVFLCYQPNHAVYGEIIFSLLAESYVDSGKGVNAVQAGTSNASNNRWQDWNEWTSKAFTESPLVANFQAERERIAAYRREYEQILQETAQLERAKLQAEANAIQRVMKLKQELSNAYKDLESLRLT